MRQKQRQRGADDDSDRHELQPLPEHASENAAGTSAERHSDPNLRRARGNDERHHSVQTDRRKQQPQRTSRRQELTTKAAESRLGSGGLAERLHIGRARRVDLRDHLFHILQE